MVAGDRNARDVFVGVNCQHKGIHAPNCVEYVRLSEGGVVYKRAVLVDNALT